MHFSLIKYFCKLWAPYSTPVVWLLSLFRLSLGHLLEFTPTLVLAQNLLLSTWIIEVGSVIYFSLVQLSWRITTSEKEGWVYGCGTALYWSWLNLFQQYGVNKAKAISAKLLDKRETVIESIIKNAHQIPIKIPIIQTKIPLKFY